MKWREGRKERERESEGWREREGETRKEAEDSEMPVRGGEGGTHIVGVPPELHHSSEDEKADSIADESKRSTPGGLLSPHLRGKPLVGGC